MSDNSLGAFAACAICVSIASSDRDLTKSPFQYHCRPFGKPPRSGGPVIELCGASLRRFQNTECRKFRLTREAKIKCSDMRRFAILFYSFFLLFLFSEQNSMAQDFMGWPNFNTVPDTT